MECCFKPVSKPSLQATLGLTPEKTDASLFQTEQTLCAFFPKRSGLLIQTHVHVKQPVAPEKIYDLYSEYRI